MEPLPTGETRRFTVILPDPLWRDEDDRRTTREPNVWCQRPLLSEGRRLECQIRLTSETIHLAFREIKLNWQSALIKGRCDRRSWRHALGRARPSAEGTAMFCDFF
jgi:hypothetical protein